MTRLFIHCPFSRVLLGGANSNACNEMTPVAWVHTGCDDGDDFIDGRGYKYCDCPGKTPFWDCRFLCGQSKEKIGQHRYQDIFQMITTMRGDLTNCEETLSRDDSEAAMKWGNQLSASLEALYREKYPD